jgi:hypothetical protein
MRPDATAANIRALGELAGCCCCQLEPSQSHVSASMPLLWLNPPKSKTRRSIGSYPIIASLRAGGDVPDDLRVHWLPFHTQVCGSPPGATPKTTNTPRARSKAPTEVKRLGLLPTATCAHD